MLLVLLMAPSLPRTCPPNPGQTLVTSSAKVLGPALVPGSYLLCVLSGCVANTGWSLRDRAAGYMPILTGRTLFSFPLLGSWELSGNPVVQARF